jgi:hypothetical protein
MEQRFKKHHKVSQVSPDHRIQNQIDHFVISSKWKRSLCDVRNKRGADIGSDHHLMVVKIKMKLAAAFKPLLTRSRKCNTNTLKDKDSIQEFVQHLTYKITELDTEATQDVNEKWQKIDSILKETSETVTGYKEKVRKDWLTENTWKLIQERKRAKAALNRKRKEQIY